MEGILALIYIFCFDTWKADAKFLLWTAWLAN